MPEILSHAHYYVPIMAVKDSESALSFGGSVLPDPSLPDDNGNSSSPDNDISSAIKSFDTEDKGRMVSWAGAVLGGGGF